jgi:glycosyltransferase involved in cell wall biosynthesis
MKKKVLYVELNQDGTVGGSYFSLLNTIRCLDRSAYEPLVMFYEEHSLFDRFQELGLTPLVFGKPQGKQLVCSHSRWKVFMLIFQKLYNFLMVSMIPYAKSILFLLRNGIDLIHLNDTASGGIEWLLAAKILGKKCVTHQRGFSAFDWRDRAVAKRFDRIICISDSVRRFLEDTGFSSKLITLYNCIDPDEFRQKIVKEPTHIRNEFEIDATDPLIGIVGNFQEWKGQITVVRAVDILAKKYPKLKCLFIGDVSKVSERDKRFYSQVRAEVSEKQLEQNVVFTGYRADIPDLVNTLDVLIHASIAPEPFGRVIIEGMSLRKAVVATDLGGPREILENGKSGVLVPPGDPLRLAEAIEWLLENPQERERLGENALRRVEDKFSFGSYSKGLAGIYSEVLHPVAGRRTEVGRF